MDLGVSENEFWEMTLAELIRALDAYKKRVEARRQEQAYFDYTLATLIGTSVARIYSSRNSMPDIDVVYPQIFKDSEILQKSKQEILTEKSVANFKNFANSFNTRFQKEDKS